MFWTHIKVKHLQARAAQALGLIRDLFINNVIDVGAEKRAWGQFFNESKAEKQYGIYGTSAGVQVLSMAGYAPNHAFIAGASRLLKAALEDQTDSNLFYRKKDIALVYKLAYIAEAVAVEQEIINVDCPPMDELMKRVLPAQGWGEFYYSEDNKDIEPKVISTVVALLALRRYRKFRASEICEKSLAWLCRRLHEIHKMATYELALASLALIEYSDQRGRVNGYDRAVDFCKQGLFEWAASRKEIYLGKVEFHHYASNLEGGPGGGKYMHFLPHCLVALALLKWDSPKRTRRYVLRVVNFFVQQILENKGFSPDSRRQVSTKDHLWIYRLLKGFESQPTEKLLPQPIYAWSTAPHLVRVIISVSLFVVGVLAIYISSLTKDPAYHIPTLIVAIISVIGSALVALFGRTIWEFFMKGDKS
jgi:hypothetical protein